MTLLRPVRTAVAVLIAANLLLLSGCGYLLYPERQGLKGGRVDPVVVVLDAAGLFFYVVPGVVAFAVDLTNGTIFVPPGGHSALDKHLHNRHAQIDLPKNPAVAGWRGIHVEGPLTGDNIARTLSKTLGVNISVASIQALPADTRLATL